MTDWRPNAELETLKIRARVLQDIRAFFAAQGVMEVETPLLSRFAATDVNIDSFSLYANNEQRYLHTSPEFPMKRLLAAGSGDIYQIVKVFRAEESGSRHAPEFTLLEWYRVGWDDQQLMHEVEQLILSLARPFHALPPAQYLTYQEAFLRYCDFDPLTASAEECAAFAKQNNLDVMGELSVDDWLDLILSTQVQTQFPTQQIIFLTDYPASQAALARLKPGSQSVASRFEVFWGDMELANGFYELTDADEQRQRFEQDNHQRILHGKSSMPVDESLLVAMQQGLPSSSGVALGFDRLLMKMLDHQDIADTQSFSWKNS